MIKLTRNQKDQFSEILEEIGKSLDITESEHEAAVKSYMAVGEQLSKDDSALKAYDPEIIPQGSFLIGTMIKPINETDDLDIDLVCQLKGEKLFWTQKELKQQVGAQIAKNKTYQKLLEVPDGRRCWTLKYRENSEDKSKRYHMDILPAVIGGKYKFILEKALRQSDINAIESLLISITDKERLDYALEKNHLSWLKSNPFGYAIWFQNRSKLNGMSILLEKAIQSVPQLQKEKLPLQRVVQILKRHRDMMFSDEKYKDDKPISIIITTLTARAYNKEENVLEALYNVVQRMEDFIEDKWSEEHSKYIKWVENPINSEENFADKWPEHPQRQEFFFNWLKQVKIDIDKALDQQGLHAIQESLKQPFGENTIAKAFNNYGDKMLKMRESNSLKMAAKTGMLGQVGRANIQQHTNFGISE